MRSVEIATQSTHATKKNIRCTSFYISFTDDARELFVKSTAEDFELRLSKEIILRGWPEDSKKLPEAVKKYANFAEEITFDQGLLFKGSKVIVPKNEVAKIVRDLYAGRV